MKSLLRNLMFVARRYRLSVVLNLLGLTAAFMVFVALLMQIDYDRSYNAALADADRIAMCLQPPCNYCMSKGRMIHIRITADIHKIKLFNALIYHILF